MRLVDAIRPLLSGVVLAAPVAAQEVERPAALAARVDRPPRIDGVLDDPAWQQATPIGALTQVEPQAGVPASEASDVRFVYDPDYLYVAIRCYDREPQAIIATTKERDGLLEVDDYVELVFDTFHDRRNAFFFQINSGGSKGDALVTNNGATFNKPWDGIWDAATRVDEQGWCAELALPFKTLNFAAGLDTWGFNIQRTIGRKRESARWSCASRDHSLFSIYLAGELRGLHGIRQGIGLDVVPFFVSHWRDEREDGTRKTLLGEPGFDLFYKIFPSLTFCLTVITDFAETEVDERQIQLTRFPLFFPERRDFFLQDAGLFAFGLNNAGGSGGGGGGDSALIPFFSRRIGLSADGAEVPILAGAKLTGRAGDYGIGLLDVRTEEQGALDGQNLFAGRITRNVGEQSTIGAILTRGNPQGDGDNSVYGLDATHRISTFRGNKDLITSGFFLRSESQGVADQQSAFGVALRAPSDLFSWNLGALEIEKNFDPALGFVPRPDIRRYTGGVAYEPRPALAGVRQLEFGLDGVVFTDTDGALETWLAEVQPFGLSLESGDALRIAVDHTHDELVSSFLIHDAAGSADDVTIDPGQYDFTRLHLELESAAERPLSAGLAVGAGEFYDGQRVDYELSFLWQPSALFLGRAAYELDRVSLANGDFDVQLAQLRADFSFTPRLSWNSFLQWDTDSDTIGVQSRLRWIPVPEQEIFLVFNQTRESDSSSSAPLSEELSFKISYALRF